MSNVYGYCTVSESPPYLIWRAFTVYLSLLCILINWWLYALVLTEGSKHHFQSMCWIPFFADGRPSKCVSHDSNLNLPYMVRYGKLESWQESLSEQIPVQSSHNKITETLMRKLLRRYFPEFEQDRLHVLNIATNTCST